MKKFEIINVVSGHSLGLWEADNADGAMTALARAAGFLSSEALSAAFPVEDGEIVVKEVEADDDEDEPFDYDDDEDDEDEDETTTS